jgi:hypothetical protein
MEGCPSTIEDSKRHRYQDENLKVQREEESENAFVQKDGLRKKKEKGGVHELARLEYRLKVHCTTDFLTFKVLDRHLGIVLAAVGVECRCGGRVPRRHNV